MKFNCSSQENFGWFFFHPTLLVFKCSLYSWFFGVIFKCHVSGLKFAKKFGDLIGHVDV